uniref:Secreted protein n=1 Tax=Anopheles farauti TaxID=69004 RepID=A0A182QUI3_9DIPT
MEAGGHVLIVLCLATLPQIARLTRAGVVLTTRLRKTLGTVLTRTLVEADVGDDLTIVSSTSRTTCDRFLFVRIVVLWGTGMSTVPFIVATGVNLRLQHDRYVAVVHLVDDGFIIYLQVTDTSLAASCRHHMPLTHLNRYDRSQVPALLHGSSAHGSHVVMPTFSSASSYSCTSRSFNFSRLMQPTKPSFASTAKLGT